MKNKRYSIGKIATAFKDIVVASPSKPVHIQWMWVANTGAQTVKLSMSHVTSGETPSESMAVIHEMTMKAGTFVSQEVMIYLDPGDRLSVKADTGDAFVMTLYGKETITPEARGIPDIGGVWR